jgi:hypothetical protein
VWVAAEPQKVVRSYRLVFRRRWRIFRIQGWRIPLPGGIELRLLGYWLACLAGISFAAQLPLIGVVVSALPASLRYLALPLAAAWLLCRWEIDGRPPHRALLGLLGWRVRPRSVAALRGCPRVGAELAPIGEVALAPDLSAARYPRGALRGPVRVLLRYPVEVEARRGRARRNRSGRAGSSVWLMRATDGPALHNGKTIEIPNGRTVIFDASAR